MIRGSNSHPTIGLFWSNGWRFLLSLTHSIIELCLCMIAWCVYIFLIWYSYICFPTRSTEDFPIFTIYSFILQYWCLLLRKNINTQEYGGARGRFICLNQFDVSVFIVIFKICNLDFVSVWRHESHLSFKVFVVPKDWLRLGCGNILGLSILECYTFCEIVQYLLISLCCAMI
jgi:hypothetical protein